MSLSNGVKDRLLNFKFDSALANQDPDQGTENENELLAALAAMFGNSGWLEGHMGTILDAAVELLVKESETT